VNPPYLARFPRWQVEFSLFRVEADIAYYESGHREVAPGEVTEDDVPIILTNLRRQLAELREELRRRGVGLE